MQTSKQQEIGNFRYLLLSTALLFFLAIVFGGMQRVARQALLCPAWLTCIRSWIPPMLTNSLVDFLHLLTTSLSSLMLVVTVWVVWRRFRQVRWLSGPVFIALFLLAVQGGLGAYVAYSHSPADLVAVHLGLALLILSLVTGATVIAFVLWFDPEQSTGLHFKSKFSRLALWVVPVSFFVLVSGVIVSSSGATFACPDWPLCDGAFIPTSWLAWLNIVHRLVVGLGGVYVLWLGARAWQTQRSQRAILTSATTLVLLFMAQGYVGALKVTRQFPTYMLALHEATAAAVMAAAVVLVVFVGLAARTTEAENGEAQVPIDQAQRARDMLKLTKPIIVALLLFTTFTGLVVGAGGIPGLGVTLWTMVGGALAAGGSGAVNQYIDRHADLQMTRTSKRPIPAGRMTPAEGLAFGVGLLFIAFYLMAGMVNLLAALLTLAGMIYYVILYSLFLKSTTVQNIVIGGGAGAIPPLVGYAAAAGRLDWIAWCMFAIIFLWTPPHFWALALIRLKDYARAGIPMLPVVHGEEVTRKQILIYTVVLVAFTLLVPLITEAGVIYLTSSIVLGLWLLYAAWRVWRVPGNKVAYSMYRWSSMYLAGIFAALIFDFIW